MEMEAPQQTQVQPEQEQEQQVVAPSEPESRSSVVQPEMEMEWPPAEMTAEWAEAIERLVRAVPTTSRVEADGALDEADGDEGAALRLLMDQNWSEVRRAREAAVAAARASGDVGRVSAVKEAELRRKATGSAQDFFKSYVETEGRTSTLGTSTKRQMYLANLSRD